MNTSFIGYNPAYMDRHSVERPIDKVHRYVNPEKAHIPEPTPVPIKNAPEEMFNVHEYDCWICPRPSEEDEEESDERDLSGNPRAVIKCDLKGNQLKRYSSVSEAAEKNGINKTEAIYRVLRHERNQTKGFKWIWA